MDAPDTGKRGIAEFSISETGGINDEPDDQTGRESGVHEYYEDCYRVHWLGASPAWGRWRHDNDGRALATTLTGLT